MANRVCTQCGAPIDPSATECKFCGEKIAVQQPQNFQSQQYYGQQPQNFQSQQYYGQPQNFQSQPYYGQQPQQQIFIQQAVPQQVYVSGINPAWPVKSKIAAGLLAIFLGGIGIHKFYLGKVGMGILYLLFCWTGIPALVGFVEGIIYLCSNDENFQLKHHVRVR